MSVKEHVQDGNAFHVPRALWEVMPEWFRGVDPVHGEPHAGSIYLPELFGFQLTKFMVLEVVAAVLMLIIFIPLAKRIATGQRPQGRIWNLFEMFLLFLRDEVVRPSIGGGKDADRFLPYIWTAFFFVLFCNLLGMVPWAGSPTGALGTTAALAGCTFLMVNVSGMQKNGVAGYWTGLVPHMELPLVIAIVLKPMLWAIELIGLLIKHSVLSVRLLANMFAGHFVLAVLLGFIATAATSGFATWAGVTAASVTGAVGVSLLELFVAFLQAYIFAFLSSLFIGMAVHQH